MSVFDFPRVNFSGLLSLNPATANNCDYAGTVVLPAGYGPASGQTLALVDSKMVRAITYGMDDAAFRAWVQKAATFDVVGQPGQTMQIVPAEWNYYGDLSMSLTARVVGVTTGPGTTHTEPDAAVPATTLLGAALTFSGGHITDVNSEGSPPATQFFVDQVTLAGGGTTFLTGAASKGACQWLNFYRNVNLTADGGAGGYVYHVIRGIQPGSVPGFDDPRTVGVVLRYYLFGLQDGFSANDALEALYQAKRSNPAVAQIVGTIAPLYSDETILTTPVGRLLVCNQTPIKTPGTNNNGNGQIALGPAVLRDRGTAVSADLVGAFPEDYQPGPPPANPKFDFGAVSLVVSAGAATATVGTVDYTDTAGGDAQGWVFDFDLSSNEAAQQVLADPDATFSLVAAGIGTVLDETDHFVVSNQQAIYAEQGGTGSEFLNQGTTEPATVSVFRRGRALTPAGCPPITVWEYRSVPMQAPGDKVPISTDHAPGQPIVVDTSQPGDYLLTFTVEGGTDPQPPERYRAYMNPPPLTNAPSISLRILPNDEDFGPYYVDPAAAEPVGNDALTFAVVYEKVLRTYYLLYPVMDRFVVLNSEASVTANAQAILDTTDPGVWMQAGYMPRTRDLSASRRQLLRAFCHKVLGGPT